MAFFKEIREDIINDILTGVYKANEMIEGQDYYSKKFGVSRATVRRAIDQLVERKILYAVKGKGTFVKDLHLNESSSLRKLHFSQYAERSSSKFTTKLCSISYLNADVTISMKLNIKKGEEIVCIKRVRLVDDLPENFQISYLPKNLVEDIIFEKESLEIHSLFQLLEKKADLIPYFLDEEIRAVPCPVEVSRELLAEVNEPVLFIRRVTHTKDDIIMEYCEDYEYSSVRGLKVRTYANKAEENL